MCWSLCNLQAPSNDPGAFVCETTKMVATEIRNIGLSFYSNLLNYKTSLQTLWKESKNGISSSSAEEELTGIIITTITGTAMRDSSPHTDIFANLHLKIQRIKF